MEYWDVCDQEGNRSGQIRPKGSAFAPGEYHPAMEAWIVNSRGEILIQQRSMQCEILPGVWGLTTGRMLAGESTLQGCVREIREELGVCVCPAQIRFLRRIPRGELLWDIYLVHKDVSIGELTLQGEEVAQARWISPSDFLDLLKSGGLFRYPEIEEILSLVETGQTDQKNQGENHRMEFISETNRIYSENDEGKLIAEITFPALDDDTVAIDHTFVDAALRGQGVAGQLMQKAVVQLRRVRKKIKPVCSYAQKWFSEHPEEADLLV